ncbi:serine protease 1-like [Drosophila tropicalis]|uniref:serine protease 1-like n=1 Tax=Drosophila tropicalis TaxID=46794 RepID=UPI0035AB9356
MMKVFLTILALAIASASAYEAIVYPKDLAKLKGTKIEGRITNGYPAEAGKAPYTVGLGFAKDGGGWWCGGSIIGNTWVVTAAHCTADAQRVDVYFGATWRTEAVYTHTVSSSDFIRNPDYNGILNDISLIRIPHVDFWAQVNKVELPSLNDRYESYNEWWAVACGWGGTYDGSPLPDWLQCVDMQIIANSECAATYGTGIVSDSTICVRVVDGKGTCQGDSGGPLVTHDGAKLVGVTSFVGASGCQAGSPAGFARITSHLDWIRDNTGISY